MIPDVNVLVAAFRGDHAHHAIARTWLLEARRQCAHGKEPLRLLPVVVAGFLRLVTNARVFVEPDAIEDAVAFVDALAASAGVEFAEPAEEWPLLRSKLLALNLQGNQVTDAWIAAAVQTHSEHLVTFDRDFRRLLPAKDVTILDPAPAH